MGYMGYAAFTALLCALVSSIIFSRRPTRKHAMPPHSNEHPHRLDNGANTPLLAAATQCDLKGVQRGLLSIEDVAPLLAADFETGSTALHRACECTDDQHIIGLVEALASACAGRTACLDARDDAGRTPLSRCVDTVTWMEEGSAWEGAVKLLLVSHADPDIPDAYGRTPLMMAARGKLPSMVNLLVKYGADIEARDVHGNTAMLFAVEWFGQTATASVRLVAGENPRQIAGSYGFQGVEEACAKALESASAGTHGEKSDARADSVTRALIQCGFLTRIANALVSAGARVDATNLRGETALHVAHPAMLRNLREHFVSLMVGAGKDREAEWAAAMRTESTLGRKPSLTNSWATRMTLPPFPETALSTKHKSLRCDIPSVHVSDLDPAHFRKDFLGKNRPLLVLDGVEPAVTQRKNSNQWDRARKTWANGAWLRKESGALKVTMGTIPYPAQFAVPFEDVSLERFISDPALGGNGGGGLAEPAPRSYLFHKIDLLQQPELHDALGREVSATLRNFSGALGGGALFLEAAQIYYGRPGTGAPMHFHSNAINILLKGSKKWFLLPPGTARMSSKHPLLWDGGAEGEYTGALTCEQPVGSFMFIPRGWSHAVINTASEETIGAAVEFVDMGSREAKGAFLRRVRHSSAFAVGQDLHRVFPI